MKVACKNVNCKNYYKITPNHCEGEDTCPGYMTNKKKAEKKIQKCKECSYCRRIFTNGMTEHHYECWYGDRKQILLMIDERRCDCRM